MYKVIAAIYVTLWVTLAIGDVGETLKCSSDTIEWYFPIVVGFIVGSPIFLGYMISKE